MLKRANQYGEGGFVDLSLTVEQNAHDGWDDG